MSNGKKSLLIVAAGCAAAGGAALWWIPSAADPSVPCPGADPGVLLPRQTYHVGTVIYTVVPRAGLIEASDGGAAQSIDTTLDHVDASDLYLHETATGLDTALILVGCDGSSTKLVVFRDLDSDGRLDDHAGSLLLGSTQRLRRIIVRDELFELFGLSATDGSVLRFADTTGDFVPDQIQDYQPPGQAPLWPSEDLVLMPDRSVIVLSMSPPGLSAPVHVYRDVDGDGDADTASVTTFGLHFSRQPAIARNVMVCDAVVPLTGTPLSTVEVWRTDEEGVKISENPSAALCGTVVLDEGGRGYVALAHALCAGNHLRPFDTTTGMNGRVVGISQNYARAESVSPDAIDRSATSTLHVLGLRFGPGTRVVLRSDVRPSVTLSPTPTVLSSTELTVSVPPLGDEWCAGFSVRVEDDDTPITESVLEVSFIPPH